MKIASDLLVHLLEYDEDTSTKDFINKHGLGLTSGNRRIKISYSVITPESAENGEAAESGWEDEEGVSMEPDEYDLAAGITAVDLAVEYLFANMASNQSSSIFSLGAWYTSTDEDYSTGWTTEKNFHLEDFSLGEEKEVYRCMSNRRR